MFFQNVLPPVGPLSCVNVVTGGKFMLVCAEIAYWARASQVSPQESVEAVLAWMIRAESKRMCRRSVWFTVEVSSCDGEIVVRMLMSRWNSVVCRGLKVLARTHIVLSGDKA